MRTANRLACGLRGLALFLLSLVTCVDQANADEIKIVAFGTSFTSGKGVWRSQAYPARLEAMLKSEGIPAQVKNQGQDGDTTRQLVNRLNWAVPEGVQIVIVEYAIGNDRNAGIPMEETVQNIEKVIARLVSRNIQVLLLIRGPDQEQLRKRTKWFRQSIDKYDILFLQIEQPESSLQSDKAHPTAEAHGLIAASMVPSVKKLMERAQGKR